MPSTKKSTKVANQIVPQERITEITFYGPMSVMVETKIMVSNQKLFLSEFPNNVYDEKILIQLLSQCGSIDGTFEYSTEVDGYEMSEYNFDLTDVCAI